METLVEQINVQEFVKDVREVEEKPNVKLPVWLKEDLIQDALKNHFKDDAIKVKSIIVENCGGSGESYASMMFRVGAYYSHKNSPTVTKFKSLILKTLPQNELALEKLGADHFNVQNKEMAFYERLIPEFEKVFSQIGENGTTFPSVMAVYRDIDLIVLEDLKDKNFLMGNRYAGLDIPHSKLALSGLAKIHAASMVLLKKDKNLFKDFEIGFYNRKTRAFDTMFEKNLEVFTEEVAKWTEWSESAYYSRKLKAFQKVLIENGCKVFDLNETEDLNAFTHGDLWTNNVLFTYNENGDPQEAVILDFQYSFVGSIALDLHYYLFTSLPDDIKESKLEELVQFYYYELKGFLQRLNYDMSKFPTLQGMQIEFLKKTFYGFSACLLTVPIQINEEDDANFEALMSVDEQGMDFKRRIYKNPRVKEIAKQWLPIFDRKGIFDEL